jgi:hypothetical protein
VTAAAVPSVNNGFQAACLDDGAVHWNGEWNSLWIMAAIDAAAHNVSEHPTTPGAFPEH